MSLSAALPSRLARSAVAIRLARRRRSRLARRWRRFDSAAAALLLLISPFLLFGPGFGCCVTTVMVVLSRSPGGPSRLEPARWQGFPIPADNFPDEIARMCDSVGKSPAWRGLDTAFPSLIFQVMHCYDHARDPSPGPVAARPAAWQDWKTRV